MFTIFDGVLLKPLPYPNPDRLVTVYGHTETWNVSIYGQQNLAYPDFLFFQKSSRSLDMAGVLYNSGSGILSTASEAEYVGEAQTTANLFSVLGLRLFKGRTFLPEEDRRGGNPVTVVSYTFWERHFTGSKNALGSSIVLDDKSYTIIGVAPRGFRLDDQEPDIFTPIGQNTAVYMLRGGAHSVGVIARMRPGKTMAQAQMELTALGNRLAEQFPATNKGRSFEAQQLKPDVGDAGSTLWLLLGAAGLVLLIACVNVASLLLARAVSRERELAMRTALGAGRGRLIRQSLTESSVLSLAGGLLGILIAALGVRPFVVLLARRPATSGRSRTRLARAVVCGWRLFADRLVVWSHPCLTRTIPAIGTDSSRGRTDHRRKCAAFTQRLCGRRDCLSGRAVGWRGNAGEYDSSFVFAESGARRPQHLDRAHVDLARGAVKSRSHPRGLAGCTRSRKDCSGNSIDRAGGYCADARRQQPTRLFDDGRHPARE